MKAKHAGILFVISLLSILLLKSNVTEASVESGGPVQNHPDFRFAGLKIKVSDLDEANKFYADLLGFKIEKGPDQLRITDQAIPVILEQTEIKNPIRYPFTARTGLSLEVDKLLPSIDDLRSGQVLIYDTLLERNGVGISIPFQDPFGNVVNLIEVQVYDAGPISQPRIYNCGVTISDMEKAIAFYEGIFGFEEWSRNYLPAALPLKHPDNSFAFMIHYQQGLEKSRVSFSGAPGMLLMIGVDNMAMAKEHLTKFAIPFKELDDHLLCQDPDGNWIEIVKI